jgi:dCTP deaminase
MIYVTVVFAVVFFVLLPWPRSGFLTGQAIHDRVKSGEIRIEPFNLDQLGSNSYDVTLGEEIRVYTSCVCIVGDVSDGTGLAPRDALPVEALSSTKENPTLLITKKIGDRFLLRPGIGYLMHTNEYVGSDRFLPLLDGKSSLGRLFATCHITAGIGDEGFFGQWTLEVVVTHPLWITIGQKVGQFRFSTTSGKRSKYKGHYSGQTAKGAVASRSWEQAIEQGLVK